MVLPILLVMSSTMAEINLHDIKFPVIETPYSIILEEDEPLLSVEEDAVNMDGICVATSFTDYVCY